MKKKIKIGIGVLIVLCAFWIGYKIFLVSIANLSQPKIKELFDNVTDLEIKKDTTKQNDAMEKMHYYVPNRFTYEKQEENQKVYVIKDSEEHILNQLTIGKINWSSLEDTKTNYKWINYDALAKKYNIQDEIDLYHYYKEHKDEKRTIFTSASHLKMDIFANQYMLIGSSGGPSFNYSFLTGDIKGYLTESLEEVNCFTALFVHEKEIYWVNYLGSKNASKMTQEEMLEILESISFD